MNYDEMGNYRLTLEAKADLKRIYLHGFDKWGEAQADQYYNNLYDHFETIAEQPYLFQPVDFIRKGYRRSICGVDSIYYRIDINYIEIMAIVGRQDIKPAI